MKRSKKIFLLIALLFLLIVLYVSYDISQRTTFPGQGPAETEEQIIEAP